MIFISSYNYSIFFFFNALVIFSRTGTSLKLTRLPLKANIIPNIQISRQIPSALRSSFEMSTDIKDNINKSNVINFIGESAKIIVSSTAGIILLSQSTSWKPLYYITGAVINAICSKLLKNIFKMPRPNESNKDGYGMPSSHAQSLFYFLSILSALLLQDVSSLLSSSSVMRITLICLLGFYALSARFVLIL